jgi:hypothetical protein
MFPIVCNCWIDCRNGEQTFTDSANALPRPLSTRLRSGNAVMFHLGRSGSTVLGDMLARHPAMFWAGEIYSPIFRQWRHKHGGVETVGEMPEDAMVTLQKSMRSALHHFYGFEIKPFHFRLIGYRPSAFLRHLDALGYTHFILLDRKNRLRIIVSSIVAHQDGRYHIGHGTVPKLKRVHVDVEDVRNDFDAKPLVRYLSEYDAQIHELEALLEGRRLLRLAYEEDIQADPQQAYHRSCEFLGIRPADASVRLARINPFPLREMIENFEEVKAALLRTPYEWMLDE